MKIRIDEKMISIPPHISTSWDQVLFLHSEEDGKKEPSSESSASINPKRYSLFVHLSAGQTIGISGLEPELIHAAFSSHVKFLEKKNSGTLRLREVEETKHGMNMVMGGLMNLLSGLGPEQLANTPLRFNVTGMDGIAGMEVLHHNQNQANAPEMPGEVIEKISHLLKLMTNGDLAALPKEEPHCNCPYCQVARSIHGTVKGHSVSEIDQPVSDEELCFRGWEIAQQGDKLYTVTNPLDHQEQYNVYLGSPVGCTCGQPHCEHIKAVLYS